MPVAPGRRSSADLSEEAVDPRAGPEGDREGGRWAVVAAGGDDQAAGDEVLDRRALAGVGFDRAELGDGPPPDGHDDPFAGLGPPQRLGQLGPEHPHVHAYTGVHERPCSRQRPAATIPAMNFAFSEEQEELRRIVRQFLESKSSEAEVRRLMETTEGYDPAVWSQMANELGLQSLIVPEEFGGQGFTYVELVVVLEEMGRRLLCAPYFSTVALATNLLLHAGDDAAKKELLPGIASGETVATVAFTEESGKWDESGITMEATASGDGYKLNGTKMFVLDGHTADVVLVAARTGAGVSIFQVAGDAEGLTRTPLATMDQTRKQAKLEFSDVDAKLIGTDGAGWTTLERVLDLAAVALAAEQVGGAQFVLEMAVQYAKDRVQFGRPIGSFQAIKHKCADMLLEVESAKSAAYYAGWCAAELNDELPSVASLAKAYCSEAYFHATAENIQIHGGIGFTWEHPAHLYFKRAKSSELLFGDPTYHRELLAQRIGI
jgi:alkylation response protein AidB-like acyl-CoA dehydrogenase